MMRLNTKPGAALKMAIAAALGLAALSQIGPAAAQSLPGGTWGLTQPVSLTALPPAGSQLSSGTIQKVSCASPGNCAAIGTFYSTTSTGTPAPNPFVLNETNGTWGTPATVAGIASSTPNEGAGSGTVSCAAPGECAASWAYPDASGDDHAYLIDESGGTWGQAQAVTIGTVSNSLAGVSCSAAGNCTAVGTYVDGAAGTGVPFVMDSSAGTWDAPAEVPGFASLSSPSPVNGELTSVSCTSAGNCVAGGLYHASVTSGGTSEQPFLATETAGSWGQAQNVAGMTTLNPGNTATLLSVSCGALGDCAAMGMYENLIGGVNTWNPWVANETGGTWGSAQQLAAPAASKLTYAVALSCPAQGFCVVAGRYYPTSSGVETAFSAIYSGGSWTAQNVAGLPGTTVSYDTNLSCAAAGYCTVTGEYNPVGSGIPLLFVTNDVNGTWSSAQTVPGMPSGLAQANGLSCTAPGYCTAAGLAGTTTFTVSEATAATVTLTASAPTVNYGNEEAGTLTATVTSAAGGTPTGTVTVKSGSATVCTITLASGSGTCNLTATQFQPGTTQQLTATYNGSADFAVSASAAATALAVVSPQDGFVPAGPVRILDTRNGTGGYSTPVGAGQTISVQVTGQNGVPATGVTAVVLNVTAVNPAAASYVTAYPDGQARPATSNLDFSAGQTVPNLVTVPVGADGKIDLYNNTGTVNLLADMAGYYTTSGGSGFTPAGPVRILDTRNGTGGFNTPVGAGQAITLQVSGTNGIPATGVTAVVLNVTAVSPTANTYITAYADGQARPATSNLDVTAGQTVPNLVIVPVASDGEIDLYNNTGTVNLLADLAGYYSAGGDSGFTPAGPERILDTRNGTGGYTTPVGAGKTISVQVTGTNGIPATGVTAVVLNVTAVNPTANTYITAYPDGQTRPATSNLDVTAGQTVPNLVVVPVGADGKVDLYNNTGNVNILADLAGYYMN